MRKIQSVVIGEGQHIESNAFRIFKYLFICS